MSLYDFLYNLQRKPYRTRRRILLGLLAVSFLILFTFWVFMFKKQVAGPGIVSGSRGASALWGENEKLLSPAAALIEGFMGFKRDITEKIGEYSRNLSGPAEEKTRPVYELPIE